MLLGAPNAIRSSDAPKPAVSLPKRAWPSHCGDVSASASGAWAGAELGPTQSLPPASLMNAHSYRRGGSTWTSSASILSQQSLRPRRTLQNAREHSCPVFAKPGGCALGNADYHVERSQDKERGKGKMAGSLGGPCFRFNFFVFFKKFFPLYWPIVYSLVAQIVKNLLAMQET